MTVPAHPKIYHIVHVDRLRSIVEDGFLWCDAEMARRAQVGTTIGLNPIKKRRLQELVLGSHPDLHVGDCVPFYFCPRSVMLYVIHRANHPELTYRDGQRSIVHLEADLRRAVAWAERNHLRWAFTLSNAGSRFFEDRADLSSIDEIDWDAVQARDWSRCKDAKQAECLIEHRFAWKLIERIGVHDEAASRQVRAALSQRRHMPGVEVIGDWYY